MYPYVHTAAAAMRQAIEDGDVETARTIMAQAMPHLPQPQSKEHAAATLHYARTQIAAMPFAKRAYSHAWLTERGLPSALPDHLRPGAERMYPRVVDAVGIAVKSSRPDFGLALRNAMNDAVMNCYADNETEPKFVSARILEARAKIYKGS